MKLGVKGSSAASGEHATRLRYLRYCPVGIAIGAVLCQAIFAQSVLDLGFTTRVSERLVDAYSQRFRMPARGPVEGWKKFAREAKGSQSSREIELLTRVNQFLNKVPYVEDGEHWGMPDYWATPAESVASSGADCEDFSIAKYFLLKELGVPVSKLRMIYVKATKLNQAHMVLAYYPSPSADPLVLDNLEDTVRPASQRNDLVPVYSFNDEELWVESRGRAGSPRQIRNWTLLLEHLASEART